MSQFALGENIPQELPPFQTKIPEGIAVLWRETSSRSEILFWDSTVSLKPEWSQLSSPWRILGSEDTIRSLWKKNLPPQGSKSIVLTGSFEIQVDLSKKSLKFSGKRIKRVLIVDDSPTIRKLLRHLITSFGDWEICGELESGEQLATSLNDLFPDLVTLDLNLTGMNGVEAMVKYLSPRKVPTILITSQAKSDGGLVMDALSAGALDYLQKPESGKWDETAQELQAKLEAALKSKLQTSSHLFSWKPVAQLFPSTPLLIAIGSSTGGTQALQEIFLKLPKNIPPILVTQHIPPIFSRALAERLNALCPFEVKEAEDGDEVKAGRILIAPGGHHMRLSASGKYVSIEDDDPINRFRPSVDALFESVAKNATVPVVSALLTGMGKDGAQGLLTLKNSGAFTIAQDEASSVVFGMPKEAIKLGAAKKIAPLGNMVESFIEASLSRPAKNSSK